MLEFSILDLKNFCLQAQKFEPLFMWVSPISVRLALQMVCEEMKIFSVTEFLLQYEQSAILQGVIKERITQHCSDLMRDAKVWELALSDAKVLLANKDCKVLIMDNCHLGDISSFFIACKIFDVELNAQLFFTSFSGEEQNVSTARFSAKDIKTADDNLSLYKFDIRTLFKFQYNYFVFDFPVQVKYITTFGNTICKTAIVDMYDLIVCQNNSLSFNFEGQQLFYKYCCGAINKGGRLLLGMREKLPREDFTSCFLKPYPNISYYYKSEREI